MKYFMSDSRFFFFFPTQTSEQNAAPCIFVLDSTVRLIHEELNQKPDDTIVQTNHLSVLHVLIEPQALSAPQDVFPGVVAVYFRGQGHGVELVAEEGEVVTVCDDSLRHKGSGDILVVPETYRGR